MEESNLELAEQLAAILEAYQIKDPELIDWRFDLHETRGIEIGLKNSRIGGPYSAPSYKRSISGEIFLYWRNKRYSSAKLDSQAVSNFQDYMNNWKTAAYYDPDGVGVYKPSEIPEVNLADPILVNIIDHDNNRPFTILHDGLQNLAAAGFHKIDGKIRCYQNQRCLRNSAGLNLSYPQTPFEFYFEVNNSYGEAFQEKYWPTKEKVQTTIDNTARIGKLLENEMKTTFSGKMRLLFPPGVFEAFLSQFLIANLYGSLVINRQSRFSLADFTNQVQVLRPDLSITVNTLEPLRSFSYRCTTEGIPGGIIDLIQHGSLKTPILNLKYATKAGLPPTPGLGGRGFFVNVSHDLPAWEDLIHQTDQGLIVYSVLGMHTQDSASGSFSLSADQCLFVEHGVIKGKVKAVISGDFLQSLTSTESYFGKVVDEDNPGYSFIASVTI